MAELRFAAAECQGRFGGWSRWTVLDGSTVLGVAFRAHMRTFDGTSPPKHVAWYAYRTGRNNVLGPFNTRREASEALRFESAAPGRIAFDAVHPVAARSFRTTKELAEAAGVSVPYLSSAITGARDPSVRVIHAIAKAAKVAWTMRVDAEGNVTVSVESGPERER